MAETFVNVLAQIIIMIMLIALFGVIPVLAWWFDRSSYKHKDR